MLYNQYKNYIEAQRNNGKLDDDMGEVMRILDLHNRHKKNIDKKYKDYTKLEWKEFKSIVLSIVPNELNVVYTDKNMHVIKYGKDDFHLYKPKYDNKTSWCTTQEDSYKSYTTDTSLYVIHYNNGSLFQYSVNLDDNVYDSKDRIIDQTIANIMIEQLEPILLLDKSYVFHKCCKSKELYEKYKDNELIREYKESFILYYYTYKIPDKSCITYMIEQMLLAKIPVVYISIDEDLNEELDQGKEYILTRENAQLYKNILILRYSDHVLLKSMGLYDPDCPSMDIVAKLYKNGVISIDEVPKYPAMYIACGITDVYIPVGYITTACKYDRIIPTIYDKTLIPYFPNHPEYSNVKKGIYNKQDTLIHFDNTVMYPIEIIKEAKNIYVCPDLPIEYQRLLLLHSKEISNAIFIDKDIDPVNYYRVHSSKYVASHDISWINKHNLWDEIDSKYITKKYILDNKLEKHVMNSKHYHLLLE